MTNLTKTKNGEEIPLSEEEIKEFNALAAERNARDEQLAPFLYQGLREAEFNKRGITPDKMIISLWERIVENRPESSDALEIIRQQIKQEIPKP